MISVLMLTYNREKLVGRAIECILKQTYTDFEFIIVDNGSSDKSGEIADHYAENDQRIKVIHRERGNIGAGRNTALDAAKGEYIAFIDDDDLTEPDFLEFLLNLIAESSADIAICGATDKVFDEKKIMTAEEALIELMWRKKYTNGFPAKLFRSSLFKTLRFPENMRYEDIHLMYKVISEARLIAFHGALKYHVYRHNTNNSIATTNHTSITADYLNEYLDVYRTRAEWLSERFSDSAAVFRYFEWSFMISMVEKIHRLELEGCEKQLELMTKTLTKHRREFLNAPEILDFEREWVNKYIPEEAHENI